jgi:prevent-host-death family protein
MPKSSYSIAEAKSALPRLIHEAEAGQMVELTRRGRPVAVVLSIAELQRLRAPRPSFMETVERWRVEARVEELDLDPDEIFAGTRDASPGKDFTW